MADKKKSQDIAYKFTSAESLIPQDHPLRSLRQIVSITLDSVSDGIREMYASINRRCIPPEKMLRALLVQVFYSIPGECLLMEQLSYNMLFRWFVGLSMDDQVWDPATFSQDRDHWLGSGVAAEFFRRVSEEAGARGLLADEHFNVDACLLEAWKSRGSQRAENACLAGC